MNGLIKRLAVVLMALAGFIGAPAYAAEAIVDLIDQPVATRADGSKLTDADLQQAIVEGCRRRQWVARVDAPGRVTATILVRGRHYAEITITYSATSYSMKYADSRELDYNEQKRKIHRNYNKWVALLNGAIVQAMQK